MGVTHLWRILEKTERPCDMRDYAGCVVAVDVSIWMHQLLHGVREKDGSPNAYLIGIFNRICTLLHHQLKPVFVFDGSAPGLKKIALVHRRKRREENEELLSQARIKMLAVHAKNVLFGTKDAPLPMIARKVEKDMFEIPDSLSRPQESNGASADDEIEAIIHPRDNDEGAIEIPSDIDKVFSPAFDELPLRMQILAVVKRNQVVQKLFSVREAIIREDSAGGPALQQLAADDNTFFFLERQTNLKTKESASKPTIDATARREVLLKRSRMESSDQDSDGDLSFDEENIASNSPFDMSTRKEYPEQSEEMSIVDTSTSEHIAPPKMAASCDLHPLAASSLSSEKPPLPLRLPDDESQSALHDDTTTFRKSSECIATNPASNPPSSVTLNGIVDKEINYVLFAPASPAIGESLQNSKPNQDTGELTTSKELTTLISTDVIDESAVTTAAEPVVSRVAAIAAPASPIAAVDVTAKPNATVSPNVEETGHSITVDDDDDMVQADEPLTTEQRSHTEPSEAEHLEPGLSSADAVVFSELTDDLQADDFLDDNLTDDKYVLDPRIERLGDDQDAIAALAGNAARAAAGLNSENVSEVQELLRLFGLPFVIAPQEAESQCAAFEASGMAAGIITDDSDVFLFGGRRVFRNVFSKQKDCGLVDMADIENLLGLARDDLIHLALLLGCDYTPGVFGVGPVYAIAIHKAFPGPTFLEDFKQWTENDTSNPLPGLPKALRNPNILPKNFPDQRIIDAFARPVVDPCPSCSWGQPDLQLLRAFASSKFGWEPSRVDDLILPLLRLSVHSAQPVQRNAFTLLRAPKPISPKKPKKGKQKIRKAEEQGEDSS